MTTLREQVQTLLHLDPAQAARVRFSSLNHA
jgi:hypothetical protein